ncbi:hypothetical protein [Methanorbis furvi]
MWGWIRPGTGRATPHKCIGSASLVAACLRPALRFLSGIVPAGLGHTVD